MMKQQILGVVALSVVALGCEKADSTDIKTSGMYATFTAVNKGGATRVAGVLKTGGAVSNTFIQLGGNDKLFAAAKEEKKQLAEHHVGNFYEYDADLAANAENDEVVFSFERVAPDESAPNSKVTLPKPLTITAPAASVIVKRSEPLTVTWDNQGTTDRMIVEVTGDCVHYYKAEVSGDPGTFVIEANKIKPLNDQASAACSGMVKVSRTRAGTLDPAFGEGGQVTATQLREVSVRIDP